MNNVHLDACRSSLAKWQDAFNKGNAKSCANVYEPGAVMHAQPFGLYRGRDDVERFWNYIIDQGFSCIEYFDVVWEVAPGPGYILRANWRMNKAYGAVHCEHWRIQSDGTALLASDHFEIQGYFN